MVLIRSKASAERRRSSCTGIKAIAAWFLLLVKALLAAQPATSFISVGPKHARTIAVHDASILLAATPRIIDMITPNDRHAIDVGGGRRHDDDYVIETKDPYASRRRQMLMSSVATVLPILSSSSSIVDAAETVGKDPACNDATCLGVWDGLLADCPHGMSSSAVGCVSSQDDTPGNFAEPWDYSEAVMDVDKEWPIEMDRLVTTLQLVSAARGDKFDVQLKEGRYLRGIFSDAQGQHLSEGEFYFTPNDTTVQFRIADAGNGPGGARPPLFLSPPSIRNIDRAESIRKAMGYLKLPVLRNRKRALLFVESDLDTFGPGSAALGPPAEMKTGELEGRIYVP